MLILSIDSSGMTASAALVTKEKILAEMSVNNKKTHSQTLLPMVEQLMDSVDLSPEAVDMIAIAEGPGSFTGLRIGAALAKGLGLALEKPLIGISTTDALAYGCGMTDCLICPMIDARHETVYTGIYAWRGGCFMTLIDTEAVSLRELAEQVADLHPDPGTVIIVCGDGAQGYQDSFDSYLREVYTERGQEPEERPELKLAPVHLRLQRAAALGALALQRTETATPADDFAPDYHRMTQAERMKKLRENQ